MFKGVITNIIILIKIQEHSKIKTTKCTIILPNYELQPTNQTKNSILLLAYLELVQTIAFWSLPLPKELAS